MAFRTIICLSAVLIQTISGQVISKAYNGGIVGSGIAAAETAALANGIGYGAPLAANVLTNNGLAASPLAPNALAYEAAMAANGVPYGSAFGSASSITSGGGFRVTSSSPIAASGVTVQSENLVIEGPLAVSGQLPFLGVVALEGPLPAVGQGAVAYGCGNGNIGITNEGIEPAVVPGYANGFPAGVGPAGLNYNGLPNGLGYGPLY
ncbi:unnamed protein product [Euphydryas editha]|uniref:Uncharacterized protein n=1 Tax=Euphydryas editha TaxID=104508 RepID=A0AAU9TE40_EUPED|nr:unnamed protein product [Euphydryas editha]